jgi:sugar O-acyltransferase (sialic acid O-acetyltransferase NeuD family)
MKKIVLLGGGGHCKSIIDCIHTKTEFEIYGIVDPGGEKGKKIYGVPVIGTDDDLISIFNTGIKYAFVTVGSIGDTKLRSILYNKAREIGFVFPVIIDKSAILAKEVIIDEGTFIGKGTIVNSGVEIGKNCIVNTGSIIEHDCYIGDLCHIAPGAVICGGVRIGECTHIGCNASIIQGVTIGSNTLIGAGTVVIKNVESYKKVVGNPSKEV